MPIDLTQFPINIGISSTALFDMTESDKVFREKGLKAFEDWQRAHRGKPFKPGTGFTLIDALLKLNDVAPKPIVHVAVMSKNSPVTGRNIIDSCEAHGLQIERNYFSNGKPVAPLLKSFGVNLFLTGDAGDAQAAADQGVAAVQMARVPNDFKPGHDKVRIAFDFDAVLVDDKSEQYYQKQGLDKYRRHEQRKADTVMQDGPFAQLFRTLYALSEKFPPGESPIELAIVTARGAEARNRVITQLEYWGTPNVETFFLSGAFKGPILQQLKPLLFLDDQSVHVENAAPHVPAGRVPTPRKGKGKTPRPA